MLLFLFDPRGKVLRYKIYTLFQTTWNMFIIQTTSSFCSIVSNFYMLSTCVSNFLIEPGHEKMCLMSYTNNKGADQPAHPRNLISAFVVRCLDSIISLDCTAEISRT